MSEKVARYAGGDIWFAFDESRPLNFFAGIWVPHWRSIRKLKEGEIYADLFGFLTTEPNAEVAQSHPKAMPVILTTQDEADAGGAEAAKTAAKRYTDDRWPRREEGQQCR